MQRKPIAPAVMETIQRKSQRLRFRTCRFERPRWHAELLRLLAEELAKDRTLNRTTKKRRIETSALCQINVRAVECPYRRSSLIPCRLIKIVVRWFNLFTER